MKKILLNIFIGICVISVIGNLIVAGISGWHGEDGAAALRLIFVFSGLFCIGAAIIAKEN